MCDAALVVLTPCDAPRDASRDAWRLKLSALRLLLLAPLLALVLTWPALAPTDPDYWWHERTGQLIAETGRVPTADPYSFSAPGQPWVTHEWLTELLFFVVHHQFGYVGNVLLIGVLGCLAALAMFATCRLRGVGELPSVVLVLWAFGMSLGSLGVRPQTVTRVLLAFAALLLTLYRQRRDRRLLLAYPPLMLLWSNLHGGFAVGLGLLGLTFIGEAIESARAGTLKCAWPIAVVTLASAAATLLTPNGLAGALYPLAFVPQATGGQQLISEWQPPDVRQLAFVPFGLSLLLALALGWVRRKPLGVVEALWAIAFALLALQSVRNIQLYATVVTPLIGARLVGELPAFGRRVAEWRNPRRLALFWTLVSVLSAGVWFARFTQATDWPVQLSAEPDTRAFPVGGAGYLRDHAPSGNLFNQFEWGGYLIYANYPQQRVFIDGRPDMYGNAIFNEYVDVASLHPNWRQILDKYTIQLVLVDRDGPLAAELARDPAWQQLYIGPVDRLFQRTSAVSSLNRFSTQD